MRRIDGDRDDHRIDLVEKLRLDLRFGFFVQLIEGTDANMVPF